MDAKQKKELLIAGLGGVAALAALIWFANQDGAAAAASPTVLSGSGSPSSAPVMGNTVFNIGSLPAGYTAQGVAAPSGADGGVTPSCQCPGAGTVYYGSPADQANGLGALLASLAQWIGPPQDLSIPVTPTSPQTNPSFVPQGFYGQLTPAQYIAGMRFGGSLSTETLG